MVRVFARISGTCSACFDLVDDDLFRPPPGHLGRVLLEDLFLDLGCIRYQARCTDTFFADMSTSLLSSLPRMRFETFLQEAPVLHPSSSVSSPVSPVLMRTESETGMTNILPSPALPVLFVAMMLETALWTSLSGTMIDIILLGISLWLFPRSDMASSYPCFSPLQYVEVDKTLAPAQALPRVHGRYARFGKRLFRLVDLVHPDDRP